MWACPWPCPWPSPCCSAVPATCAGWASSLTPYWASLAPHGERGALAHPASCLPACGLRACRLVGVRARLCVGARSCCPPAIPASIIALQYCACDGALSHPAACCPALSATQVGHRQRRHRLQQQAGPAAAGRPGGFLCERCSGRRADNVLDRNGHLWGAAPHLALPLLPALSAPNGGAGLPRLAG